MPTRPRSTRIAEGIVKNQWPTGRVTYTATIPEHTDRAGRRHRISKTFGSLSDAREWRREQLGDRAKGIRRPATRLTLGAYLEDWLPRYATRNPGNTAARYKYALAKLAGFELWRIRLADLEPHMIRDAYDQLASKDVAHTHQALHRALRDAIPRLLVRNPAAGAARDHRHARPERLIWTASEYRAWLAAADEHDPCPALWWTLGQTGLRRGELLGLEWPDHAGNQLTIRRQYTTLNGRHVLKDVKTSYGRRTIQLDQDTINRLSAWRDLQSSLAARRLGRDQNAIWTHVDGKRLAPTKWLKQRHQRLVAQAGIRMIGLHDIRHTHATLLLQQGVPVHVVSRRLGHASEAFTLQQYAHVLPDQAAQAADAASRIVGP